MNDIRRGIVLTDIGKGAGVSGIWKGAVIVSGIWKGADVSGIWKGAVIVSGIWKGAVIVRIGTNIGKVVGVGGIWKGAEVLRVLRVFLRFLFYNEIINWLSEYGIRNELISYV